MHQPLTSDELEAKFRLLVGNRIDADAMIATAKRNKVLLSTLLPGRDDGAIRSMATRVHSGSFLGHTGFLITMN